MRLNLPQSGGWSLELFFLLPTLTILMSVFILTFRTEWIQLKEVTAMLTILKDDEICIQKGSSIPFDFASHDEAVNAMTERWHTKTIVMPVPDSDRRRVLDAWDGAVAHQIFFGIKYAGKDILAQLEKDRILLSRGMVRHVIWHFFANPGNGTAGPSRALRIKLRKAGIGMMIYPSEKVPIGC